MLHKIQIQFSWHVKDFLAGFLQKFAWDYGQLNQISIDIEEMSWTNAMSSSKMGAKRPYSEQ